MGGSSAALGGVMWRVVSGSMLTGLKRASRLRFWAVAASRNSSLTPFGPLRREAQDPLETGEQYLDFLPPATGLHVLRSCGVRTGHVASIFVQIPRDPEGESIRTALRFEAASVAI